MQKCGIAEEGQAACSTSKGMTLRANQAWVLPGRCQLILDRGEHDYFIGAYTVNLIVTEFVVTVASVIGILVTWPDVPWRGLMWVPLAVIAPIATVPFARSAWLALDLVFRPPEPSDFRKSTTGA